MFRKGQVTVFIIIGILALAVMGAVLYLFNSKIIFSSSSDMSNQENTVDALKGYVTTCLTKSVNQGMREVLAHGGFPSIYNSGASGSENRTHTGLVPLYFVRNQVKMPSIEQIEAQISKESTKHFYICLDNFNVFKNEGLKVTVKDSGNQVIDPSFVDNPMLQDLFQDKEYPLNVSFTSVDTQIYLYLPLVVVQGGKQFELSDFHGTIPFDFQSKYKAISLFLQDQARKPTVFLASDLSELSYAQNAVFTFKELNDSEVLVGFSYDDLDTPIVLNFGLKYDFVASPSLETPPILRESPIVIDSGVEWNVTRPGFQSFQFHALGTNLHYESYPLGLPIDSDTGVISLDVNYSLNGEYLYYIIIHDGFDNQIVTPFFLNVNVQDQHLPSIHPLVIPVLDVGKKYEFQLVNDNSYIRNDEISYLTDDSYLFFLNQTSGKMLFVPSKEMVGIYSIRITAQNQFGLTWQRFEVVIK